MLISMLLAASSCTRTAAACCYLPLWQQLLLLARSDDADDAATEHIDVDEVDEDNDCKKASNTCNQTCVVVLAMMWH